MVPPPPQQHTNDSTCRNNAIPPPLIRGYGYAKSDPKFQDPKLRAAFLEMKRKQREREAKEEVSKKRQAIGRADGRGYQFQTLLLVAPSLESSGLAIPLVEVSLESSGSSLQMSNESSLPYNDNPAVEMVNPTANDSESENEFELQPDNTDALKAKVGVSLFPHLLCPLVLFLTLHHHFLQAPPSMPPASASALHPRTVLMNQETRSKMSDINVIYETCQNFDIDIELIKKDFPDSNECVNAIVEALADLRPSKVKNAILRYALVTEKRGGDTSKEY
jgi:hypothetical protein